MDSLSMSYNNAMHLDSAITLRFYVGDPLRGAGDADRSVAPRISRIHRYKSAIAVSKQ
jgi:hypothetical protein